MTIIIMCHVAALLHCECPKPASRPKPQPATTSQTINGGNHLAAPIPALVQRMVSA
jgi:hypothetical protein